MRVQVGRPETQKIPGPDLLQASSLSLTLQLLPSHFHNGQLILKCTAIVATLYRETADVSLGTSPREPIPERGSQHYTIHRPPPSGTLSGLYQPSLRRLQGRLCWAGIRALNDNYNTVIYIYIS